MAINQKQVLSLQQKLSPQQIQMIKLLELPTVQLEQRIKQEIEDNIVLEEEDRAAEDEEQPQQISVDEYLREDDTPSYKSRINNYSKDDKQRPVFLTEGRSLQEYLIEQLGFRNLSEREMKLAVYLVGSIDEDGYLRRDLNSIADDIAFSLGIETDEQELEKLLLRVSDTGCGIPEVYQRSIFQPFFRVDKSRSREYGGAGLGLSLVWEIADLHGGCVRVEESSDEGTTIAVELPVQ